MKELIPGAGQTPASKRLDELFSRDVLGAVLFGAAVSKVVEKINILLTFGIIIYVLEIGLGKSKVYIAVILIVWWSLETVFFIYLYVKWEKTVKRAAEKAEKATEAASEAKDKVKKDTSNYEINLGAFGKEVSCEIEVGSKK